jgi:hypothetical protein
LHSTNPPLSPFDISNIQHHRREHQVPLPATPQEQARQRLCHSAARHLEETAVRHRSHRMSLCGQRAFLDGRPVALNCHSAACPRCHGDRCKVKTKIHERILAATFPSGSWVVTFVLTRLNVEPQDLQQTVFTMADSAKKLLRRKVFEGQLGALRSLEVTIARDGRMHPHIHGVLVASSLSQAEAIHSGLQHAWAQSAKLDYVPNTECAIFAAGDTERLHKAVSYALKLPDVENLSRIVADPQTFLPYYYALTCGKRLVVTTGLFRFGTKAAR